MNHGKIPILLLFISTLFLSCNKENLETPPAQSKYTLNIPPHFPYPEIPENNQLTQARVALGKKLFYDPILSRDSSISCASCHKQELAFADSLPISPGVEGRLGFRNAPTLANVAYLDHVNKDGGVRNLGLQALVPIEDENEMDMHVLHVADRLKNDPEYVKLAGIAYDREPDPFVITRALAAFEQTMISGNSRYDQYAFQNKSGVLNESEKRGMELFFGEKANCGNCHSGFNFSNNAFENNGLYEEYQDLGRRRATGKEEDIGKFRVPTLRNIALTAPYMHDGSLPTLEAVLDHYTSGGSDHSNKSPLIQLLDLQIQQKEDLVAFLRSLTDSSFTINPEFSK